MTLIIFAYLFILHFLQIYSALHASYLKIKTIIVIDENILTVWFQNTISQKSCLLLC